MSEQIQITKPLPMDIQTELMLKYGPKDTCWATTYEKEAEPLLQKYFIKSATLGKENNPMAIAFFEELERKWNDHIGILTIDSQSFEMTDIAKTKDIPTIQGLQYCCRLMISAPVPLLWQYHGVGNSSIEPRAYQQRLYGEIEPRANMKQAGQGSLTRVNQSIRAVGIFPSTFPSLTIRESAIFTNSTGYTAGVMLNRQVFASNPIGHTVNVSPFTVATDINFASETKWG